MTEKKEEYATVPRNLNELKKFVEGKGKDWTEATTKIKEATKGKGFKAAMDEGWTIADFWKVLNPDQPAPKAKQAKPTPVLAVASPSFTEAPASFNVKAISPEGFDIMLTLRDDDTAELMKRIEGALKWLSTHGFSPTTKGGNGLTNGGNGQEGKPETKTCPLHHVSMKLRSGKGGDTWYSHKAVNPDTGQEYWCKGEQK